MLRVDLTRIGGLVLLALLFACSSALGQSKSEPVKEFPLWKFDEMTAHGSCRNKGRFQDKEYCDSQVVDQVLALGKDAIPILIGQLTDTRQTKHSIYDLWNYTAAGDIANTLLFDLFTASDWSIAPMPELDSLRMECSHPGESCWRKFLHKKGRKFVQDQWQSAWDTNKDRIYWDEKARCFRVMPHAPQGELAGRAAPTSAPTAARN